MRELVFCLEEESAKVLLEQVVSILVPEESLIAKRYIVFEGKQDLEKRLPKKLSAYLNPKAVFIVMRDQDAEDCRKVKEKLIALSSEGGKDNAIVCVACRELEAFYIGDLRAVELGLGIAGLAAKQNRARFRIPDHLHSPSKELQKLTGDQYQKIAGSRAIAPHLDLTQPRSKSFGYIVKAIRTAAHRLTGD